MPSTLHSCRVSLYSMLHKINVSVLTVLGAYYEGKYVGTKLAECIKNNVFMCEDEAHYDAVHVCGNGAESLSIKNGWGIPDL